MASINSPQPLLLTVIPLEQMLAQLLKVVF